MWCRNRRRTPCQLPAVTGWARCRLHGGAEGSGAGTAERLGVRYGQGMTGQVFGWLGIKDGVGFAPGGDRAAVLNYHERIANKIACYRTRKDSNFKPSSVFVTMFQIEKCWRPGSRDRAEAST
jgi:hypothetical protein